MSGSSEKDLDEIRDTLSQHGYELMDRIGCGRYGAVFTVRSLKFDEIYVVKILDKVDEQGESIGQCFECEVHALVSLVHPNIVCVYGYFASEKYYYVVLEYCEGGSLSEAVKRGTTFDSHMLRDFVRQIVSALAYLHSQNFCHRDIKPANILIDKHGRPKLADFGFARSACEHDRRICGSLPYMAPELINRDVQADPVACDVWALGITIYHIAFGRLPWQSTSPSTISKEILAGAIPLGTDVPVHMATMLRRMLRTDPKTRISMKELLELKYLEVLSLSRHSSQMTMTDVGARKPKIVRVARGNSGTRSANFIPASCLPGTTMLLEQANS
jgi:maternal embryonic leucine zipper kinase